MEKVLEICAGSYEDALSASECGVKRIELNSALSLGGLTPSVGALSLVKQKTDLEVICMVRPRAGGFCYRDREYEQMIHSARKLLEAGADGIAFGFLNDDFTLNNARIGAMVKLIHSYGKTAVFHRAFDVMRNPLHNTKILTRQGVDRILTSGCAPTAVEGMEVLKRMQEEYGNRIEIMAGCGINEDNARMIMAETGISSLHASCRRMREDPTTSSSNVSFAFMHGNNYDYVSRTRIRKLMEAIYG